MKTTTTRLHCLDKRYLHGGQRRMTDADRGSSIEGMIKKCL